MARFPAAGERSVRAWGRTAWVVIASAVLSAVPAGAQPLPPPPLKPGEVVAVTKNGCAVIETAKTADAAAKFRDRVGGQKWTGECRSGLAHGAGLMTYNLSTGQRTSFRATFLWGREPLIQPAGLAGNMFYRSEDGRTAQATSDSSLDNPVWRDGRSDWNSSMGLDDVFYDAWEGFESTKRIYGVQRWVPGKTGLSKETYCPDRFTPVGCEGLWRQLAGPKIAEYKAFRAQVERREAVRRVELEQLNAAREARFAALAPGQAFDRSQAAARAQATGGACSPLEDEARVGAALKAAMARISSSDPVARYEAVLASLERSAAAWARCPQDPNATAKVSAYRKTYVEVSNRCAMVSPSGACTARTP